MCYNFLLVFGCFYFIHLWPYSHLKLKYCSLACVIQCYLESYFGYRCKNLMTKKKFISRIIHFDESFFFITKVSSCRSLMPSFTPKGFMLVSTSTHVHTLEPFFFFFPFLQPHQTSIASLTFVMATPQWSNDSPMTPVPTLLLDATLGVSPTLPQSFYNS